MCTVSLMHHCLCPHHMLVHKGCAHFQTRVITLVIYSEFFQKFYQVSHIGLVKQIFSA